MSTGKNRRGNVKEMGPAGVQAYLKEQVPLHGGMIEHFTTPGKKGAPDFLVTWPAYGWPRLHLVECKTIGGALDPWQVRDHERRGKLGCYVRVLWTKAQVDSYVQYYAVK
jgi:hypothetical protein